MATLAELFKQEIENGTPLGARDIIALQAYMDGVFRLIIFMYSLALGVLALTYKYKFIFVLLFLVIVFCISYAFFTLATIGDILLSVDAYNRFNLAFYYIETILLTLLFCTITYYLISSTKKKKHSLLKRIFD